MNFIKNTRVHLMYNKILIIKFNIILNLFNNMLLIFLRDITYLLN